MINHGTVGYFMVLSNTPNSFLTMKFVRDQSEHSDNGGATIIIIIIIITSQTFKSLRIGSKHH